MTAQKLARQVKLREWARQIAECENSGMKVREWCEHSGVGYKNYFYRKRRVREEFIDIIGTETSLVLSKSSLEEVKAPMFTELPVAQMRDAVGMAATVRIGTYTAEINNGADIETIDGLLRTLSSL